MPLKLDRDSPIPLYMQLKDLLLDHVKREGLKPGDRLPTEEDLQAQHRLSRTTIRRAFHELEVAGVITRTRRRGTFVAQPRILHRPELSYDPFGPRMDDSKALGWKLLAAEWIPASTGVAERLQIAPGTQTYRLQRLHTVLDKPIGYHIAHVSPAFTDAIEESRLTRQGTLDYLDGSGHLKGSFADRIIEAVAAEPSIAELLLVPAGAPLMKVQRLVYSQDEEPIEDLLAYYRGDHFLYRVSNLPSIIAPDTDQD